MKAGRIRSLWLLGVLASVLQATSALAAEDLLAKARAAYALRADAAQGKLAVALFKQAQAADPKSYEAAWEGARSCYCYGNYTRAKAPEAEKLQTFDDGIQRARAAVALKADGAEGHFWLGVLLGVYGETKGVFKALGMVPDIKKEMEACLKLDETVECYGPCRVLGRLYFKLPFFKGGDNQKSLEYLERGVKGCPTNLLCKFYLAETLRDEGQKARAMGLLQEVLRMPPHPEWIPEDTSIKADAERLLKKWGG